MLSCANYPDRMQSKIADKNMSNAEWHVEGVVGRHLHTLGSIFKRMAQCGTVMARMAIVVKVADVKWETMEACDSSRSVRPENHFL